MIQKTIRDNRGELIELDHNDPRYWEGPWVYVPFPKLLFHATAGDGFTNPEMKVVTNQHEMDRLGSDWAEDPDAARAIVERRDAEMARVAAERHHSDQRMSPSAQVEALAADRATDEMLPSIPEQKRRGRPRKSEVAS